MKHITLHPGDVRQSGDEVQHREKGIPIGGNNVGSKEEQALTGWQPVRMLGKVILPVDIRAGEYRRFVK